MPDFEALIRNQQLKEPSTNQRLKVVDAPDFKKGKKVCIVDADKNRSALAYASRGNLPFSVFP